MMRRAITKIMMGGLLCAFLLLCVCFLVYADDMTEVTDINAPAGVTATAREEGFHGMLGAGVFAGENTVGHRHLYVFPLPFVSLRYSDWAYWRLNSGGVWLLQSPDRSLKLGLGLRLRFGWNENDDDSLLRGMADRRTSVDGSVNAQWRNPIATINVSYFHDILGVSDGDGASISVSHVFPIGEKFMLTPFASVEWQNNRLVNYYYGVRPEEVTAARPEYRGRDTVNVSLGLFAAYRLNPSWSIIGGASVRRLGDGISDSPIVLDRYRAFSFVGVGWRF